MDLAGLPALHEVVRKLQKRGVRAKLCNGGVFDTVADGDYADDVAGVLRRLPERSA